MFPPVVVPYGQRSQWHPTPLLLPGKSYGWRSLVGCSPWGREELDMSEWLHFHFSLLCIGEGNGSPLQCSCLENPRVGVAQSQTWLKWLSSSSSSSPMEFLWSNPAGLQSHILWGLLLLPDLQPGNPAVGLRTFTPVEELLECNYFPVCGSPTWCVWDLILWLCPSTISYGFFFVFGCRVSFW